MHNATLPLFQLPASKPSSIGSRRPMPGSWHSPCSYHWLFRTLPVRRQPFFHPSVANRRRAEGHWRNRQRTRPRQIRRRLDAEPRPRRGSRTHRSRARRGDLWRVQRLDIPPPPLPRRLPQRRHPMDHHPRQLSDRKRLWPARSPGHARPPLRPFGDAPPVELRRVDVAAEHGPVVELGAGRSLRVANLDARETGLVGEAPLFAVVVVFFFSQDPPHDQCRDSGQLSRLVSPDRDETENSEHDPHEHGDNHSHKGGDAMLRWTLIVADALRAAGTGCRGTAAAR